MFWKREVWPETLRVSQHLVQLKASPRAKRLSLRVKSAEGHIILTAPPKTPLKVIEDFAQRYAGWIETRALKLTPPKPLSHGDMFLFQGKSLELRYNPLVRGVVLGEETLEIGGLQAGFQRRFKQFLMQQAKIALHEATAHYAQLLGVTITKITLRDTRSRWGSCSSKGALNYSWRVIFAPPEVLRYLCAHEVAHRVEMNHSARFWAIVEKLYPDYEQPEKWLKKYGAKLHQVQI